MIKLACPPSLPCCFSNTQQVQIASFLWTRKRGKDKTTLKDPHSFLRLTSEPQQINSILLKCLMSLGAAAA